MTRLLATFASRAAAAACAAVFSLMILPAAAGAATITVGTNGDDNVADPGDCELREAILASNTDTAQDGCGAGSGFDTITFSSAMTITPTGALPSITGRTVLDARGGADCTGARQVTLDGTGALAGANGLELDPGSDLSTICGFTIGDFDEAGIRIDSDGNAITFNRVGTDTMANGDGIYVGSAGDENSIGGSVAAAQNLVSGNDGNGVYIDGGDRNSVQGNYVGTNASGDTSVPNSSGVLVAGGSLDNVIGGEASGAENLISGNTSNGVWIDGSTTMGNRVEGNTIGSDATGSIDLGNGAAGVRLTSNTQSNQIGGDAAGEGNLVSGNGIQGIYLQDADGNDVQGNLIGTDASGQFALPNGQAGVELAPLVNGAANNRIGAPDTSADATTPGARNVISGNPFAGIRIVGSETTGNEIEGNFIGTNAAGTAAIPNGTNLGTNSAGVNVESSAAGNRIGGTVAGAGNVISGNSQNGIWMFASAGLNNTVEGNLIGTDRTGGSALGNGMAGAQLDGSGTTVGGTATGTGNAIAHNADDGVSVITGTGNRMLRNSIFSNGNLSSDLGIDLFPGGVAVNDLGDPDTGSNNLQNFPVLTGAQTNSVDTTVQGALNSTASQTFRVELFSNPSCDTAGNGEGRTFLGSTDVMTDGGGDANITATVSPSAAGQLVTATATNTATNDTSEFSLCQAVASKAEPPVPDPPAPDPPAPDPGGGSGGGGSGGGAAGGADTREPALALSGDEKQKNKKKVKVEASCDEDCTVVGEGTIKIPEVDKKGKVKSKKEKFDLKDSDELDLVAGDAEKLTLEFKNKAKDALEEVIEKEKSEAKVTVTATDAAGNATVEKFEIKVKK